jgi:hypothetical protein
MSAEFMTEYDDQTNWNVIESMERNIGYCGDVFQYVQSIQEAYAGFSDGKVELQRMIRAAQLITGRKPGDFSQDVQSVYHGELLGIELVNTLQADTGTPYKMGFAQRFMRHHLRNDLPKKGPLEPSLEIEARHNRLARTLQVKLAPSEDEDILNPLYARFSKRSSEHLTDDLEQQYYTMMGFRMVVTEALAPSMPFSTQRVVEKVGDMTNESMRLGLSIEELVEKYRYSEQHIRDLGIESIKHKWQNISYLRRTLLYYHNHLDMPAELLGGDAQADIEQIDAYSSEQLEMFIEQYDVLKKGDSLAIFGDYFAISHPKGMEPFTIRYDQTMQIKGVFDSIQIVDVPSSRHLKQVVRKPDEVPKNQSLVHSIAIRLKDPVYSYYAGEEPYIYPTHEETIDIPLIYGSVVYHKLELDTLDED